MSTVIVSASLLVSAAAVLVGLVALAVLRTLNGDLALTMDLLTAAGVLHLASATTWRAIISAMVIVLIRKLVVLGLHRGRAQSAHAG